MIDIPATFIFLYIEFKRFFGNRRLAQSSLFATANIVLQEQNGNPTLQTWLNGSCDLNQVILSGSLAQINLTSNCRSNERAATLLERVNATLRRANQHAHSIKYTV